jgi:5-methylcytosine-specific restriction endonuclease McrA
MRETCRQCGNATGYIETRGGQDCVFCGQCGRFQYNAPRAETGREVRSLRTRPDLAVGQRTRILDRDGGRCVLCHSADRPLDVGHLVSVAEGREFGLTDDELFSDENLAAMCAPCNSGYSARSVNPRLVAASVRAAIARSARRAG